MKDGMGVNSVKDASAKVLVENEQVKEVWRTYIEKLLNEDKISDIATCHSL